LKQPFRVENSPTGLDLACRGQSTKKPGMPNQTRW
jgi:hypothetical protein